MAMADRSIDWRWRHGPVSGPLHGAVALGAASLVGTLPVIDLSPELVLAGGAGAAGMVALRSRYDGSSWTRLGYRLGMLGGGTVWLAQAVDSGWSGTLGWTLAAGAVTAGLLWRPVQAVQARAEKVRAERVAEAKAAALDAAEQARLHDVGDMWVSTLAKIARIEGCMVANVEEWWYPGPDGQLRQTGYTIEVVLPRTGATWRSVANHADALESAVDLPEGCGIEVGPGLSKRRCLIEVATVDALRDDLPYRPATEPGSIDAIPLGTHRNGSTPTLPLRFESTLLVGAKRSGKTNALSALLGRILECDNTLVCVIDYNGAAVALPWLAPWVEGEISNSPILWAADNPAEAERLCDWLLQAIEFRRKYYHAANTARNDDKIDASPQVPQIILVADEFAALDRHLQGKVSQINGRGGGAAITTLICSLGSTADYIPPDLRSQMGNRVAMRVNDESALGYLFEWRGGKGRAKPEDAPYTGYGHYRTPGGALPKVFKAPRMLPTTVRQVAATTAAWRPRLDEPTAHMSPEAARLFAERWERSAHLLAAAAGKPVQDAGGPSSPSSASPSSGPEGGSLDDALDGLDAAAERLQEAMRAADAGGGTGGGTGDEFEKIVAELDALPELLVCAIVAFRLAERMHTRDLAAALGVRPESLGHLLSSLDVRPLPNAFSINGSKPARGYQRADLEAAAERILRGELVPPEHVKRWRPKSPDP